MAALTGFFHGGITVRDIDRSPMFYRDALGLEMAFDCILDAPYLRGCWRSPRFMSGGLDIVSADCNPRDFLRIGGVPLNCIFHERALFITDSGDVAEVTAEAPMEGRLWRVDVGVEGMPLFRGAIG